MDIKPLTLKDVIDANIASLEGRGRKLGAFNGHKKCLYRYDDGCGCAVGVAIPDDHPFLSKLNECPPTISGSEYNSLTLVNPKVVESLPVTAEDLDVIRSIQSKHDDICLSRKDPYEEAQKTREFIAFLAYNFEKVYPGEELPDVLKPYPSLRK